MIVTHKIPYRHGELRLGWASWDEGQYEARSIKFAYPDSSGKISRGSPELPLDILLDMVRFAADRNEIDLSLSLNGQNPRELTEASKAELLDEKKTLSATLVRLQGMVAEIPWAPWQPVYDKIGARLDAVKTELASRN